MPFNTKIIITALGIVGFDAVASFLSRSLQFEYTRLMWVSFLIYVVLGYWGAHRKGLIYGVLLATVAGVADSTIGWSISRMIGPFLEAGSPSLNPLVITIAVIIVIALASFFGLVGAALCKVVGHTRVADA